MYDEGSIAKKNLLMCQNIGSPCGSAARQDSVAQWLWARARSVAVNTPPCHGGDRRFNSGRARQGFIARGGGYAKT